MASSVQYHLEQMLPELHDLEYHGLFNKEEIKMIVKQRTQFEYKCHRIIPLKIDFLRYIEYEENLERLRFKRKERFIKGQEQELKRLQRLILEANSKDLQIDMQELENTQFLLQNKKQLSTLSDYSIIKRIHGIYSKLLKKFSSDSKLWIQYLDFCKKQKSSMAFSKNIAKAISFHSNNPVFWILGAEYEFHNNNNIESSRILFQRSINLNPEIQSLWLEYFKMELLFISKIQARRSILLSNDNEIINQSDNKNIDPFTGKFNNSNDNNNEKEEKEEDEEVENINIPEIEGENSNILNINETTNDIDINKVLNEFLIPKIIFKSAIKFHKSDLNFRMKFIDILKEFPNNTNLLKEIFNSIKIDFNDDIRLNSIISMEKLYNINKESVDYLIEIKNIIKMYESSIYNKMKLIVNEDEDEDNIENEFKDSNEIIVIIKDIHLIMISLLEFIKTQLNIIDEIKIQKYLINKMNTMCLKLCQMKIIEFKNLNYSYIGINEEIIQLWIELNNNLKVDNDEDEDEDDDDVRMDIIDIVDISLDTIKEPKIWELKKLKSFYWNLIINHKIENLKNNHDKMILSKYIEEAFKDTINVIPNQSWELFLEYKISLIIKDFEKLNLNKQQLKKLNKKLLKNKNDNFIAEKKLIEDSSSDEEDEKEEQDELVNKFSNDLLYLNNLIINLLANQTLIKGCIEFKNEFNQFQSNIINLYLHSFIYPIFKDIKLIRFLYNQFIKTDLGSSADKMKELRSIDFYYNIISIENKIFDDYQTQIKNSNKVDDQQENENTNKKQKLNTTKSKLIIKQQNQKQLNENKDIYIKVIRNLFELMINKWGDKDIDLWKIYIDFEINISKDLDKINKLQWRMKKQVGDYRE